MRYSGVLAMRSFKDFFAKDTQSEFAGSVGGLYIGAGNNLEPGSFWSGLIDDVPIYDRAITP